MVQVARKRSRFVTVLLDGVSDPHNLAAVIRSLDAFGFQEAHAVEGGKVRIRLSRRVTRGADRWVDLFIYPSSLVAAQTLKRRGYKILAAVPPRREVSPLQQWSPGEPTAFAFGNEHRGLSEELLREIEGEFTIPLQGMVESLNVSVAVAITLFFVREKMGGCPEYLLLPEESTELVHRWIRTYHPGETGFYKERTG